MKIIGSIIALTLLLVAGNPALAQGGGFSVAAGMASFQMNDMKNLQEYILSTYPVEGKITSSFPPYTSISVTGFKDLYDHMRVGGGYSYSTTGGKSSYADYSGNIYTTMNVTSHRLGAYLSYRVTEGDRLNLNVNGRLDANYSTLSIESYYSINTYASGISNYYHSISPSASIGTELMYKLGSFSLGVEGGYLVDFKGKLKDTNNGDPLSDPNDRERVLRTDWSGWYVQLKFLVWIRR